MAGSKAMNRQARLAGGLWLLVVVAGMFAELGVRSRIIVSHDPALTAANILASEPLFRIGIAADLIGILAYAGVTLLLYELFRPANRGAALFAAAFGLGGSVILAVDLLNLFASLVVLKQPDAGPEAARLAAVFLRLHGLGYLLSMVFFAVQIGLLSYLVLRAPFFSKLLGLLLAIEAACNLFYCFAAFLAPAFAGRLGDFILMPGLVGELSFALWLTLFGAAPPPWRRRAAPSNLNEPLTAC